MKRIGIDARLYTKTGVGVYIRNLLYQLSQLRPDGLEFYVYCMQEDSSLVSLPSSHFTLRPCNFRWHSIGEQTGFARLLTNDRLDLMHFTYFSYPMFYSRPFVATAHDVILLQHKTGRASTRSPLVYHAKHLAFRQVFATQLKNARLIIVPTKTVAEELITLYGDQYRSKIKVLYEGVDYRLQTADPDASIARSLPKRYFMYVGNFYPHKNIDQLLRAFAKVDRSPGLVLVGPADFFSESTSRRISELGLQDRVTMLHNLTDAQLAYAYHHADALIHPSLAEGFGLPLVEAMAFGKPVIASDIPVFRELLGDRYVRFDPTNADAIAEAITGFIAKPVLPTYGDLTETFSFPHMTAELLQIYRDQS